MDFTAGYTKKNSEGQYKDKTGFGGNRNLNEQQTSKENQKSSKIFEYGAYFPLGKYKLGVDFEIKKNGKGSVFFCFVSRCCNT